MSRWLLLIGMVSLFWQTSCASTDVRDLPENFRPILESTSDPTALSIIAERQHLFQLNESVGYDAMRVVLDAPERLVAAEGTIATRLEDDLQETFGPRIEGDYLVYLLAAESDAAGMVIFVTRVHSISEVGAYSRYPGLVYYLGHNDFSVQLVGSTEY